MIEILSDYQSLHRLREPWNELAAGFPNPTLRHECAVACADVFAAPDRLVIFLVRSGSDIRAIAPFRLVRRAHVTRMELLTRAIWEPSGFLYRDEEALEELWDALLASRQPLRLGRFLAEGAELRQLRKKLEGRIRFPSVSKEDSSVWVPLGPDWARFEASMSSNRRADIRRKRRRAEHLGTVQFQALSPDTSSVLPPLREAFRVEAANWKGRNGSAILTVPRSERFFTDYAQAAARMGILRLFFLTIGGETAAIRIALEHGNRLWDLKVGYDERFQDCSPGVLLTHETLRYGCERGLSALEFMGQAESWEYAWTKETHRYVSLTMNPLSISGGLSFAQNLCWDATKAFLKGVRADKDSRKERIRKAGAAA
jgi:CelD/BcsL family acetyltransferase involved in cellulose biosynthesis